MTGQELSPELERRLSRWRPLVYVVVDAAGQVVLDLTRGTAKAAQDAAADAAKIPWFGLEAAGFTCRRARLKIAGPVTER